MIYNKLKAQKLLIGKNMKAFSVSVLPFFMAIPLLYLNYYLLLFLKNNTDIYLIVKMLIGAFSVLFSAFIINTVIFIRENWFYRMANNCFVPVRAADIFCYFGINILKMLLFFSWSSIFFSPSAVLLYCFALSRAGNYSQEIKTTLLTAALITAFVGLGCFFVIWGRYSKSTYIQLKYGELNPVKVLAKSTESMEYHQLKYAAFRLSFVGWNVLCLLLFPFIYVLPYKICARYVFFNEHKKKKEKEYTSEKPVVFIFG